MPRPGFDHKVFYVWFDAPIAYIAAARDWAAEQPFGRDWRDWCDKIVRNITAYLMAKRIEDGSP